MRRAVHALAIIAAALSGLAACGGGDEDTDRPDGPALTVSPLPGGDTARQGGLAVPVVSAHVLGSRWRAFGGWSGLSVQDGRLTAVSDRGYWLQAELAADGTPRPETARMGVLKDTDDTILTDNVRRDAEALAALPGGGWLVAFERDRRIWHYPAATPPFSVAPQPLTPPPGLDDGPYNGGPESLAVLSDGRLLVLEEGDDAPDTATTRGWLGTPDPTLTEGISWASFRYRVSDRFRPVDAAVAADGDVVVLERFYTPEHGVASRLKRIAAADLRGGATVEATPLLELSAAAMAENYEGLALSASGLHLISDDNYSGDQRTILLTLRP